MPGPKLYLMGRGIEISYHRSIDIDEMHFMSEATHGACQLENPVPRTLVGGNGREYGNKSDFHENDSRLLGEGLEHLKIPFGRSEFQAAFPDFSQISSA